MQPEQVREMLDNYRQFQGRCEYLELYIRQMRDDIEALTHDVAEGLALSGSRELDGMPHGTTVSNPTERMGVMLASGYMPPEVAEIEKKITEATAELKGKRQAVLYVEAWIKGLPFKKRWIIEHQIFDKMTYAEMISVYRDEIGDWCSKDSLRRLSKEALAAVYEIAR